jgi:Winged helix DNA-binding domain
MLAVVRNICGLQAQVMSAAALALAARVNAITPADVAAALWTQRTLVKLWAMRGTLHLLPASEVPLYVAASRPTRHSYMRAGWLSYYGLTADEFAAILEAARTVLSDQPMTRAQFSEAVVAKSGSANVSAAILSGWGSALKPASYHGYLCFGPSQGQNITFVQTQRWLAVWQDVDEEYAIAEVVRRYLHAYGPMTMEAFALWWGVAAADAKRMFRRVSEEIVAVEVEGWKGWALAADVPQMEKATATTVRLLPNFDPYTLAANRGCAAILPDEYKARVYRVAGWISPVLLVNGAVAGVWQYTQQRGKIIVQVEPFSSLSAEVEALVAAETERIGRFLGGPVQLTYGQVNYGKPEAAEED